MALELRKNICPNCFFSPYKGGICPRCKYTATENDAALLPGGAVLSGRYILGRLLGVGGFGVTYLTLDIADNGVHAVKEYFPTSMAKRGADGTMVFGGRGDRRVFDHGYRSFKREAEYLKLFRGESRIVQTSDAFDANGTTYLVMEYLDGVNLKALLRGLGGKIPLPYALEIMVSTAKALEKVHAKNLIHRDISPENIFITKVGDKKIIDFGAVKDANDTASDGAILLKPGFAPPEQYSRHGNQGPWTDVYALAATFYFVASGVKIPDAKEREAGVGIAPLESLVPEVGIDLSVVVSKALELDTRRRYRSARDFCAALPLTANGRRKAAGGMAGYIGRLSGVPYIMIEQGRGMGEKWPIPQNIDIRVGRQSGLNNVVIFDRSISREHAVIRYDSGTGVFILTDVSTNGTFTDEGVRYNRGQSVRLAPGSRFYLAKGNIMMQVGLG
jgi:serine/threonine protein kinase